MRPEKNKKIDVGGERIPLTDSPFAQLAATMNVEALPPGPPEAAKESAPEKKPAVPYRVERTRKGGFNLAIEKRASGKVVTVLRGIHVGAEHLLGQLKKLCGAGGATREDGIEIQGDHRDRIEKYLKERLP